MPHPNEVVVRSALDAFSTGNMDAFAATLHPDVVFHEPGNNDLAGDHRGIDEVLGFVGKLVEYSEGTFNLDEVHDVLANDDHVVDLLRLSASKGGKAYSFMNVTVYHVEDGKISEAWFFLNEQSELDELLS